MLQNLPVAEPLQIPGRQQEGNGLKLKKPADRELNSMVGNRIREARSKAGVTQQDFAEYLDMSTKYIANVEAGRHGITLATLKRICELLPVSSEWLLFGEERGGNEIDFLQEQLKLLKPEELDEICEVVQLQIRLQQKRRANASREQEKDPS